LDIFKRVHAPTLAAVGLWCFIVAFVGGLLGLVLGNIRLPILLPAGSNPAAVGGANIAVSGLAASAPDLRAAVLAGAVIGAIGGLIGLILGTLRVPALIRWVGGEPARIVGTNLVRRGGVRPWEPCSAPGTPAGSLRLSSSVRSG
jgi:hypothetical protein